MKGTFLFLGTGGSSGVPMLGCGCRVCSSDDPKNKRLRPSGLLRVGGKMLLIDSGPDLRYQALRASIDHVDGVLLTHTHFDHIAGLDELRVFYLHRKQPIPVLLSQASLQDLKRRYDYLFKEKTHGVSLAAQLHFQVLDGKRGETMFLGLPVQYLTYFQGGMEVNGFRLGEFAYVSDIRDYDDSVFEELEGVKLLVISALRSRSSIMHLSFDEAAAFAKRVGAERTYFTHLSHESDHEEASRLLPAGCFLAYDSLECTFNV